MSKLDQPLPPSDPEDLTPEERIDEVATILARGLLRLNRAALAALKQPSESSQKPLAVSAKQSVHGPGG